MTAAERAERAALADQLCAKAFEDAGCPEAGVALVAVGGYGREELAPYSDLDVVLVHDSAVPTGEWAGAIWYPLWDSGMAIDHSVRTLDEVLEQCGADLKVALGMLDVRHLAGDPNLTLRLRTAILAAWRRGARERLPELRELVRERGRRTGELADAALPDLKESIGGLRDATVLKALVATWLVDVPHTELERTRRSLLDVRDALHSVAGRATDRVTPEYWPDIAQLLGLPDALSAQLHTRALGRRLTHVSRLTWRRVDSVLRAPSVRGGRRPRLESLGGGVAISDEEVVLDRTARPQRDPLLLLRAAAEAAERDLVLAPTTAARLVKQAPDLPDPWPAEARDLLVRLLGAGHGLLAVWETLDETGAVARLLPEWDRVRLLPHASTVHQYTVDRHQVQSCIEASKLVRRVNRPDLLIMSAFLHDIGKGETGDHCVVGEPIARDLVERLGFPEDDVEQVAAMVRWHLLLPSCATNRDPEDPATVDTVLAHVRDREELELLSALTEADARATSAKAWTTWRAGLIRTLVRRCGAVLDSAPLPASSEEQRSVPDQVLADPSRLHVSVRHEEAGDVVTVMSGDRVGLLADAAGMLALQRATIRGARVWTQKGPHGDIGISEWAVDRDGLDAAVLRNRLEGIVAGDIDVAHRVARGDSGKAGRPAPMVVVHPDASQQATVLEVRAGDQPGLVFLVCQALASLDLTIRSAHIDTLGAQAVDVFYVQEPGAGALTDERAASAAHAIRRALGEAG